MDKKYILPLFLVGITSGLCAQDLRTEITVDRTVQPVLRDMTRISGITPVIPMPNVVQNELEAAEYTDPGIVETELSILPIATWADSIAHTPYRGYASVGYLPMFNLGANVGYRFIESERVGLGLWLQYDGESYKGDMHHYDGARYSNHTATLGGNMGVRFTRNSRFTGDGSVTYRRIAVPYFLAIGKDETRDNYTQSSRNIDAHGLWQSRTGDVMYSLGGILSYFTMGRDRPASIRTTWAPVRQAFAQGSMSIGVADEGYSVPWLGFDADFGVMRSRGLPKMTSDYRTAYTTDDIMLGSIRPYLNFDNDGGLVGHIGVNVGIGSGYKSKTTIAPDVKICWRPLSYFSIYGSAGGGQRLNHMHELLLINPYLDPGVAYGSTNLPLVLSGGLNLGPYDGMELGVYGGYAQARDYLSPLITIDRQGLSTSTFMSQNVNSWYIGAHLGFAYQRLFSFDFDIKYGGSDKDTHTWYEWTDAAKVVANASLKVTAINRLDLRVTYDMRYQRKATSIVYPFNEVSYVVYVGTPNLGTINDVGLSVSYQVTPQFTAFIKGENLLNCKYMLISGMPAQGVHGLVGAAYKF